MVQEALYPIQNDSESGTVTGFDCRSKMLQHRLYLAPVGVIAKRGLQNHAQQVLMFMAHSALSLFAKSIVPLPQQDGKATVTVGFWTNPNDHIRYQ